MPITIPYLTEQQWLELRTHDITSTESAALFNASPYVTQFELWHAKRDRQQIHVADNERMVWGKRLEPVIAAGIAEDNGWKCEPLKEYMRHSTVTRMGASFDFSVTCPVRGPGILEIKNVDFIQFKRAWIDDEEEGEAPTHIEFQLQHQLEVSDRAWGAIGVLIGGNAPRVFIRGRDRDIGAAINQRIEAFWKSVDAGFAPEPDFSRDADAVRRLYVDSTPDTFQDLRTSNRAEELCRQYEAAAAVARSAESEKKAASAELLTMVGDCAKAETTGFRISAGTVAETEVSYTRKAYRNMRITQKKANL